MYLAAYIPPYVVNAKCV